VFAIEGTLAATTPIHWSTNTDRPHHLAKTRILNERLLFNDDLSCLVAHGDTLNGRDTVLPVPVGEILKGPS